MWKFGPGKPYPYAVPPFLPVKAAEKCIISFADDTPATLSFPNHSAAKPASTSPTPKYEYTAKNSNWLLHVAEVENYRRKPSLLAHLLYIHQAILCKIGKMLH